MLYYFSSIFDQWSICYGPLHITTWSNICVQDSSYEKCNYGVFNTNLMTVEVIKHLKYQNLTFLKDQLFKRVISISILVYWGTLWFANVSNKKSCTSSRQLTVSQILYFNPHYTICQIFAFFDPEDIHLLSFTLTVLMITLLYPGA